MSNEEEDKYYQYKDHFLFRINERFKNPTNETEDFSKPYLRPIFFKIYPLIIFIYAILIISGIIVNLTMLYHILKFKLYKDPTHAYLINMIISDIIKCLFSLPLSLAVILIDNWIFGKFLCYFLPMLQDFPFHISMMTYLLIAVDRLKVISEPGKPRIPAFVCSLGTWFFAGCIVLPYPIYTTYLDLGEMLSNHFEGLEICFANLLDDMRDYMRGLFIGTYAAPLAITAYVYVKASKELQFAEDSSGIGLSETRGTRLRQDSIDSNDTSNMQDNKREPTTVRRDSLGLPIAFDDIELNIPKEARAQKYLIFMVSVYAICLCPLMILRLAKLALYETYENSSYFDILYILFVWIAFLPSVTTPVIYAFWQMTRKKRESLRNYCRSHCCYSTDNGSNSHDTIGRAGCRRGSSPRTQISVA
ncbi:prolactin-releasing peptide receptor isoform X2 [Leptopilina heterotoma]|uniref:prolactin-releasing peptide receptor isoform X2 n=1 Tax=Leptopilina heterotoma TaxID=63436 RepID=UPI001CA922DC|nr:prolactin-releasing peptide receptor isoform X2 [Leptopilina heterotoma]